MRLQPLRALPEVQFRDEHAHRAAVDRFDGLAVVFPGYEHVVAQHCRERQVRRVVVVGNLDHVRDLGCGIGALDKRAEERAAPVRRFFRPARDAMNVAAIFGRRQRAQLVVGQLERGSQPGP